MTTDETPSVLTPLNFEPMVALGNKLWRKEVLRQGTLFYQNGKFEITPEYLDSIHAAYQDGAIGSVPLVGVNKAGEHDESTDLQRWKGNVVGLERTADGLAAICELGDEADALVRNTKRKLGVSVLVKHNRTTGGGKQYPAVLAHVASTFDPVINNLADWEEIAASQRSETLLALSDAPVAPPEPSAPTDVTPPNNGGTPVADTDTTLSAEDVASLRSLASLTPALTALLTQQAQPAAEVEVDEEEAPEFTDEDIAALAAELDDTDTDVEVEEPELVAASHDSSDEVLALSHKLALAEQANQDRELRLAQVESELNEKKYLGLRDNLAREFGVHPRITDMARPFLEGAGVGDIALSNGTQAPSGDVVLNLIKELARSPRLDLSQAVGSPMDVDESGDDKRQRDLQAFIASAKAENGL